MSSFTHMVPFSKDQTASIYNGKSNTVKVKGDRGFSKWEEAGSVEDNKGISR